MKTIYLAGGCFWGTEHFFRQFSAVKATQVGYANGSTEHPTYEQVRYEGTGHTETVKIDYDETALPTQKLIGYFFLTIDPLSVNKQGEDEGVNYRTGIYYTDESLRADIDAAVAIETEKQGQPLAVEVCPLRQFFPAEEYHQKYLVKNPTGYCHIPKKLFHLEENA